MKIVPYGTKLMYGSYPDLHIREGLLANVWPLEGSQVGAIPIGFSFTPRDHGAWYKKDAPDLEYRDLGLKGASGGVLDAEHVRVAFGGPDAAGLEDQQARVLFSSSGRER